MNKEHQPKRKIIVLISALCLLGIIGCGEAGQVIGKSENTPHQTASNAAEPPGMEIPDSSVPASDDAGTAADDELENWIGEYDYLPEYGTGKLVIEKTSYGYDISDYESDSSYRFLANSSNVEAMENNRIYIKYPEQVFSDDTVIFGYYILECSGDEITAYYRKTPQEEAQFLYCAAKKNGEA